MPISLMYLFAVSPLWALLLWYSLECRPSLICTESNCLLSYAKLHFAPSGCIYQTFLEVCWWKVAPSGNFRNERKCSDTCSISSYIEEKNLNPRCVTWLTWGYVATELRTKIKSPESLSNALQPFYFPQGHLVKDLDGWFKQKKTWNNSFPKGLFSAP